MTVWVHFDKHRLQLEGPVVLRDIKNELSINTPHIYFTYNGRKLSEDACIKEGIVRASSRILGGKGGFGSMLRAIGAQIEKTTNREACRDLSGRRLRDINEEKRLKNWIAQQAEREREAAERRKKKLERLCFEPKHDFSDQNYEQTRTELTEKVYDAVEQGFRSASTSTSSNETKRKLEPQGGSQIKKKKTCLWVDDFDEDDISSDDSDSGREEIQVKEKNNECKSSTTFQDLDKDTPMSEKKEVNSSNIECSQEQIKNTANRDEENHCPINENHNNEHVSPSESSEDTCTIDDGLHSPEGGKSNDCSESCASEKDSDVALNASC